MHLDLAGVHHDPDPLSHGLGRQVASKLGAHRPGITVGTGHLAPEAPHSGLLSLSRDGGLVLGLVDIGAPLTHIPPGLVLVGRALAYRRPVAGAISSLL